jgi:hypothetical protein
LLYEERQREISRREIFKSHVNKMSARSPMFTYVEDNEHE